MTNTFKKSLLFAFICLTTGTTLAQTALADLNFEITGSTTAVPSAYTYSSANTPSIKTQNSIKCIIISDGGGSNVPTFNDPAAPSGGKRWMAFCPAVDCDVVLGIMSNKKKFYIQSKTGEFFAHTNTANQVEEVEVKGLKAGSWYAMCGASSQVYITKATFTASAPAEPVAVTGVTLDKTELSIAEGKKSQLTATVLPANADNKKISWSSNKESVATVDQNGWVTAVAQGSAVITVTTEDGNKTATCAVIVTAAADPVHVTSVSLDKTELTLKVGESNTLKATVNPADADDPSVTWSSNKSSIASVDANGKVTGVAEGTAVITVTTKDGNKTATCTVTVTAATPVPQTDLTLHEPEIYEAKSSQGGYDGTLSVFNEREYEVYYATYDNESHLQVAVTPTRKTNGITETTSDNYSCKATDGWFEVHATTSKSDYSGAKIDEFEAGDYATHKIYNDGYYKLHIKGYDQFSFFAKDNNAEASKGRHFKVFIDDVEQPAQLSNEDKIRRYDISTGEHVIEVRGIGGSNNYFYAFSLRVAQEPRVKWYSGNDSTQTILQTQALNPITYTAKYDRIAGAEIKLEWAGAAASGFNIVTRSGAIADTLILSGKANCPVGTYNYALVAYYNGQETRRATGKFSVKSQIRALTDTVIEAFQGEDMDEISFSYYALSGSDVKLAWTGTAPAGIHGSGSDGVYTISGVPTTAGIFNYTVTVKDGNSISGQIEVKAVDLGNNPILYLYKNDDAYDKDGIYTYLTSAAGGSKNLIARKAKTTGKRTAEQYSKYNWVLISEDVDANNTEVLEILREGAGKPILNLKGFTYAPSRLGWGDPDNGSVDTVTHNGQNLFVQRADHPIFAELGKTQNEKIQVLASMKNKGLMPVFINKCDSSVCLATAYTRSIDDYYHDGELQTVLHEIPATLRPDRQKYICFPIAQSATLSNDGKQLLNAIIKYLLNNERSVALPNLEITSFSVNGVAANIDQKHNLIDLTIDLEKTPGFDISNVIPAVTVRDAVYTHVVPYSGETVDFSKSYFTPVVYVVTDYINRRAYDVTINTTGAEGIEAVYTSGEWVNVYDIYGHMITTTNQDINQIELPHGMYIIVTTNGGTLKIMR